MFPVSKSIYKQVFAAYSHNHVSELNFFASNLIFINVVIVFGVDAADVDRNDNAHHFYFEILKKDLTTVCARVLIQKKIGNLRGPKVNEDCLSE